MSPKTPATAEVGIGWRHAHYAELLAREVDVDFLEVHSENFFAEGGAALQVLMAGRERHEISLHGVGLGLGSAIGLDPWHLDHLAALVRRVAPRWVSDHACFSRGTAGGRAVHAADLLPIPFSEEALKRMASHVVQVQDRLQRPILVENLSAYLPLAGSDWTEADFLSELAGRTGCGLLVDLNNLYVNALNALPTRDPEAAIEACLRWMARVDGRHVGELHLAGHRVMDDIVIDDHGSRVSDPVWRLYAHAQASWGRVPTLIEWDTDLPTLDVLLAESERARRVAAHIPAPDRVPSRAKAGPATQVLADRLPPPSPGLAHGQAKLLEALWAPTHAQAEALARAGAWLGESAPLAGGWARGLRAYRSNAAALAERALGAAYPACAALLGEDNWRSLARSLWQVAPPRRGDLAEWGDELAAHVGTLEGLCEAEPWLQDLARLEWALHRADAAADAVSDPASLSLLAVHPPECLRLQLAPGTALVEVQRPVHLLREAILGLEAVDPAQMSEWAHAAAGARRSLLVWRAHWRGRVRECDAPERAWVRALMAGHALSGAIAAIEAIPTAPGDAAPLTDPQGLAHWLRTEFESGLLVGVAAIPPNSCLSPAPSPEFESA